MHIHTDWSTPSFDLPPAAPRTGPFPHRPFLSTWWERRARPGERLLLIDNNDGLLALVDNGRELRFAGESDLTDYHSPLGSNTAELVAEAVAALPGRRFSFDSLPFEAAEDIAKGLADGGAPTEPAEHTSAAVLHLPASYDNWLANLGKKERHEVRRKRRKAHAELGPLVVERWSDDAGLDAFVSMHRSAPGDKGRFMTETREAFFRSLVANTEAVVDVLTTSGRAAAALVAWETESTYYLYNSAYDTGHVSTSLGAVLLSMVIEAQIARGTTAFDFLKGDEAYKYRLGARPRPLFVLEGQTP